MAEQGKTQQASKVLRIGIVQGGRLIHERMIRPGQNVTIGDNPKSTLVFPAKDLPGKQFTLFQAKGEEYILNYTDKMTGAVGRADGSKKELEADPSKKGAVLSIALSNSDRGKVAIDDITVLFQFVAAPPESVKAASGSAKDFRPKFFDEDDPVFYSFLGMVSALAAALIIYVVNTEPVIDIPIEDLERYVSVTMNVKPPETQATAEEGPQDEKPAEEKPKDDKPKEETPAADSAPKTKDQQRDAVAQKSMVLRVLGTTGSSSNGAVADMFQGEDVGLASLESGLQGVTSANMGSVDGREGVRGGEGGAGTAEQGIGGIGSAGGGTAKVADVAKTVPKGKANFDSNLEGSVGGESADKIRAVVRSNQGGIKSCYDAQLKVNPTLNGRISVLIDINAGRVGSASVDANTTGDNTLGECIRKKVRSWRFPEDLTESGVSIPFALAPG
jgi:hypothetical protein